MLRILVLAFLASQDVTAMLQTDINWESNQCYGRTSDWESGNPYMSVLDGDSTAEDGIQQSMEYLQDITADLGLKISGTWLNIEAEVVSEDFENQEFCSALENKSLQARPDYPDPIVMLGLQNRHCPIKKGTFELPRCKMPDPLNVDFRINCDELVVYRVQIEGKDSTPEHPDPYIDVSLYASSSC